MSRSKNCWEIKNCGREPGGGKVDELGICPAAIEGQYNGINRGFNGGRFCWAIAGTLCGGKVQGIFTVKIDSCINCNFLKQVEKEEDEKFVLHPEQTADQSR